MKQDELKKINHEIGSYVATGNQDNLGYDRTLQIATMMIDSYGDTVYVWVEEADDHCRVSDGGRILL